jgi:hypothetical protein
MACVMTGLFDRAVGQGVRRSWPGPGIHFGVSSDESTSRGQARERPPLLGEGMERRRPDSNRGIADLQSAALPLGYGAVKVSLVYQLCERLC